MATTTTAPKLDSQLTNPLSQLRGYIFFYVLVDVALFALLFVCLAYWFNLAFDYGLFKLFGFDLAQSEPQAYFRGFFLVCFILLLGGLVLWRVRLLLTRDFSYSSLALVLEKRYPQLLGDRLITAVELADVKQAAKYGYSADMIEQTIEEARERVGSVSVFKVFNWKRLRNKVIAIIAITILGVGAAGAAHVIAVGAVKPRIFGWKFVDVSSIWAERNVLLQRTPWPRRAYVEIVGFPENGDLRVPKGDMPTVQARVYKWVHVDRNSFHGWQPLRWKHLTPELLGFEKPDLLRNSQVGSITTQGQSVDEMPIDQLELLAGWNTSDVGLLGEEGKKIFTRLEEIAEDPAFSRVIRKLDISGLVPKEIKDENGKLVEVKQPTITAVAVEILSGNVREFNLTREEGGIYSGVARDAEGPLKESVKLSVQFEDFRTENKSITLIPPPALRELKRTEYQPAYLYHPAPTDGDQSSLTGLKQRMPTAGLSLNGDRTLFSVPAGTEVDFDFVADKPLKKVLFGIKGRDINFQPTLPQETGFETFSFKMRHLHTIRTKTEFELTMIDMDNVSSKRLIEVNVVDDQEPMLELTLDAIRKIGSEYWITPKARVPFDASSSSVTDDNGIREMRLSFSWTAKESEIVDQSKAGVLTGLALSGAFSPSQHLGTAPTIESSMRIWLTYQSASQKSLNTGSIPLEQFRTEYDLLPKKTLKQIEAACAQADLPKPAERGLSQFKFNTDRDFFDLMAPGTPKLLEEDKLKIQPRYELLLNMEVTDNNSEYQGSIAQKERLGVFAGSLGYASLKSGATGVGRTSKLITPIRFLIVAEEDLLAKISGDEEDLARYAIDSLNNGKDASNKLMPELSQLNRLDLQPEQRKNSLIRFIGISQDITRIKDTYQTMLTQLEKVLRELEYNRFSEGLINRWRVTYKFAVDGVLKRQIADMEAQLNNLQTVLGDNGRVPTAVDIENTRTAMTELIKQLQAVADLFFDPGSQERTQRLLADILKKQNMIQQGILAAQKELEDALRQPRINITKQYTMKAGQKATFSVPIVWGFYFPPNGKMGIRLEIPEDTGIKGPNRVEAKDDREEFALELTAGQNTGLFTIKLTPDVGKTVELRVEVQK